MLTLKSLTAVRLAVALACVAATTTAGAHEGAHVHGVVRLDVAVDAHTLTIQLESPLDNLIGFEHRPRTVAQRSAADALLRRMKDVSTLLRPDPAAQCTVSRVEIESEALQPLAAGKEPPSGSESEHADFDGTYEFMCRQPERLAAIEISLFEAFKRLHRIEVQFAGPKGQFKQTLQRPDKLLRMTR